MGRNIFEGIPFRILYSIWPVCTGCLITLRSKVNGTNFIELWSIAGSGGLEIWVSSTSFQISDIGWPQQPLAEKLLKFNMIFHDSNKKKIFSKHQNKAEFKNLDDSLDLNSDFPGLRTSTVSMTSTASMTSVASMTSTASIHQKFHWSWWLDHPRHPNDQYQSLFVEWIIKSPVFHWYLIHFLPEAVEASRCYFFKNWSLKLKFPKPLNLLWTIIQ